MIVAWWESYAPEVSWSKLAQAPGHLQPCLSPTLRPHTQGDKTSNQPKNRRVSMATWISSNLIWILKEASFYRQDLHFGGIFLEGNLSLLCINNIIWNSFQKCHSNSRLSSLMVSLQNCLSLLHVYTCNRDPGWKVYYWSDIFGGNFKLKYKKLKWRQESQLLRHAASWSQLKDH